MLVIKFMSEKPIKVPIQKVDFQEKSDFHVEHASKLSSDTHPVLQVDHNGHMEITLAKLVQFLLRYDQEELLNLYGKQIVKIAPEFLVELAAFESDSESDEHKVSWILSGLVLGMFVGLIIFLIFLK